MGQIALNLQCPRGWPKRPAVLHWGGYRAVASEFGGFSQDQGIPGALQIEGSSGQLDRARQVHLCTIGGEGAGCLDLDEAVFIEGQCPAPQCQSSLVDPYDAELLEASRGLETKRRAGVSPIDDQGPAVGQRLRDGNLAGKGQGFAVDQVLKGEVPGTECQGLVGEPVRNDEGTGIRSAGLGCDSVGPFGRILKIIAAGSEEDVIGRCTADDHPADGVGLVEVDDLEGIEVGTGQGHHRRAAAGHSAFCGE